MKIMSDAEAFGWKFLGLLMTIVTVIMIFSNTTISEDTVPVLTYDTVYIYDTVVVHDTIYKYKDMKVSKVDTLSVNTPIEFNPDIDYPQ